MIITKPILPFDLLGCTGFVICFDENFKIRIVNFLFAFEIIFLLAFEFIFIPAPIIKIKNPST